MEGFGSTACGPGVHALESLGKVLHYANVTLNEPGRDAVGVAKAGSFPHLRIVIVSYRHHSHISIRLSKGYPMPDLKGPRLFVQAPCGKHSL